MQVKVIIPIIVCLSLCWVQCQFDQGDDSSQLPAVVDFNYHVKPILSDRCFKCHGPDANERKGDLRLDVEEDALAQTSNESSIKKFIINPGQAKKSELIRRLESDDPQVQMPPPESHLTISAHEVSLLKKWIDQGAEYKAHWSFIPPEPQQPPEVEHRQWVRNPMDHFVLAELEQRNLNPSDRADRSTLQRRLALDLTGLPPTIEEQRQFLTDRGDDAVEREIDRLLSSKHFGERLALEWLDVGRYADSHGYQDDGMRNTWPWRDWVIKAFNQDMPYDTFLLWQMAGDLLPNSTKDQLLATCFNRNHPQTQEGGVVDEEYRVEYVADRTNTLGKGLLGLTVECARCHDHKYDPLSQEEYYSLYAYFNNNNDAGIVPYNGEAAPTLILPREKDLDKLDQLQKKIEELESQIVPDQYVEQMSEWLSKKGGALNRGSLEQGLVASFSFEREINISTKDLYLDKPPKPKADAKGRPTYGYYNDAKGKLDAMVWGHIDDRPEIGTGYRGHGVHFLGDAGIRFNRDLDFDRHQPFSVGVWVKLLEPGIEGPIFGNTNGDFEGYRGWLCKLNEDGTLSFQLNHVWPDNAIDYQTVDPIPVDEWIHLAMTYDGSSRAEGVRFYINGNEPNAILHVDNLKKSLLHGVAGSNWSNQPFILGMELRKSIKDMVMDELSVYDRELAYPEVRMLADQSLEIAWGDISKKDQLDLYLLTKQDRSYNNIFTALTAVRKEHNLLMTDQPEVMIMQEKKEARPTFVLDRGMYDSPTKPVDPAIPAQLAIEGEHFPQNRLGLAQWLIHPKNPLTARVMVNRLWHLCFGKGLVATQEDFGNQGNLPSHPELLDWLALRFIELDWSIKDLLREIVSSATYQQLSIVRPEAVEIDPENRWLAYFPAHRLKAEVIRDQALAASSLLVRDIGGPSVYPYQPPGIWKALATRNATKYVQQHGDSLYRRSMYTVWKRSSPPPAMLNFDAPDRYYCVVRRQETSTPLQSLVLMNDPQFLEASRVLASQLLTEDNLNDAKEKVDRLVRSLLSRAPREDETKTLIKMYEEMEKEFQDYPADAHKLLQVGEYSISEDLNKSELAAWTLVVSAVMNYDEFVTKR